MKYDLQSKATTNGNQFRVCFCIGPQNGDPVCPCRMRNVKIIDGRYKEILDLGPAYPNHPSNT